MDEETRRTLDRIALALDHIDTSLEVIADRWAPQEPGAAVRLSSPAEAEEERDRRIGRAAREIEVELHRARVEARRVERARHGAGEAGGVEARPVHGSDCAYHGLPLSEPDRVGSLCRCYASAVEPE